MTDIKQYKEKRDNSVEAIQFDVANGSKVAKWCGGELFGGSHTSPFIHFISEGERVTVSVGDYVVKRSYGVFYKLRPKAFDLLFEEIHKNNLVDHAYRELNLLGEEPETILGYLKVVRAFSDMGHSGGSASVAIPVLNALFQQKNLMPLTDNPDEWQHIAEDVWGAAGGIWQNTRDGEAFSNDGGKTYYRLSEGGNDTNREPLHTSEASHK